MTARIALLAVLALAATACQLRVGTDIAVEDDGSGTLAVVVALDEELATSLSEGGFDPFAGLEELPDGWESRTSSPDGGRRLEVATSFADPAGLVARVGQLRAGLDAEDPLVLDDVSLQVDDDGARFAARAGLRPPASTGIEGGDIRFDGEALAAVLEERGDELVRVDLRLRLPGRITDSDADEVDGGVATWRLAATELRAVSARSEPVPGRVPLVAVAGGTIAVTAVVFVLVLRRRRR